MKKHLLFLFALFVSTTHFYAAIVNGTCGENLTWSLNTQDSTLTIEGSGAMTSIPWSEYMAYIRYVNLPDGLTSISSNAFNNCTGLTSINIPKSVISIEAWAFMSCTSLTSIIIPNNLTNIGTQAFLYCHFASVTIGSSVTSIGKEAFWGCGITSLTIFATTPPSGGASSGIDASKCTLYVPTEAVNTYANTIWWEDFKEIKTIDDYRVLEDGFYLIGSKLAWDIANLSADLKFVEDPEHDYEWVLKEVELTLGDSIKVVKVKKDEVVSWYPGGMGNGFEITEEYEGARDIYFREEFNQDWANFGGHIWMSKKPKDPRSQYDSEEDIDITFDKYKIDNYVEQYGLLLVSAEQIINENNYLISLQFYVSKGTTELVPGIYPIVTADNTNLGSVIEGTTDGMQLYGSWLAKQNSTGIEVPLWFLAEGNVTVDEDHTISVDAVNTKGAMIITKLSNGKSGKCGNNLTWHLSSKDSTLTIEGSGEMTSWSSSERVPWYEYHSNISSVYLPVGLTNIGKYAFSGCENLTSITIPNGVTNIDNYAFANCISLKSVTIPNSMTSIGGYVFSNCTGLTSVTIPNSIKTLENYAFEYCSNLTSITIPNSVTSIGKGAFRNCSALTSIAIPNSVLSIGNYAFQYCSSLTDIYVSCGDLERIQQMLNYDYRVKYVPHSYSITANAVNGYVSTPQNICEPLELTAYPNYGYHFAQWSDGVTDNPRTIELTQDTTFTAEFAINQYSISVTCDETYGTIDGENGEYDYLTEKIYEAIPNYGYHFDHWSDGNTDNPRTITLTQNTALTAIFASNKYTIWDNSIQSQGSINGVGSFDYLIQQELTATPNYGYHFVQWSDGITDNPRTITLTQDTTFTAEFAVDMSGKCGDNLVWALEDGVLTIIGFGDMWSEKPWSRSTQQIKQVIFPKGLTSIGGYTFTDCTGLTSVSIPANVTMVGEGAFYGCTNITSFEGPVVAFESMVSSKIASVVINSGELNNFSRLGLLSEVLERLDLSGADCAALPKRALYDFYLLRELALPANLETIGYMSVAECVNLKKVEIPASVITIDQRAFENCRSLSGLTFAEGSKLETIGSWAFYNCHNLPKIEIPDGVTEIGDAAFYGCVYAENLKIPASVRSISDNAFALCSKLSRMDVDAVEPPTIVAKTFYEVSRKAPVYVPDESINLYKADPLWGEMNIVGQHEAPTAVETITNHQSPITNKILRNGQILILRAEKVYTVTGQEVK